MSVLTSKIEIDGREISFQMELDPSNVSDIAILYYQERGGPPEPEVIHLLFKALRPGDLAVDGGANVGYFSLVMAKLVGETGLVWAFEPGIESLGRLRHNLSLNNVSWVSERPTALWSENTEVNYYCYEDGGENSVFKRKNETPSKVLAGRLDDALSGEPPRLLKLDIEGSEPYALEGAGKLISMRVIPFVVCELNHEALYRAGSSPAQLRDAMWGYGYETFILCTDGSMPVHVPHGTEIVTERLNLNVLFSTVQNVGLLWPKIHL